MSSLQEIKGLVDQLDPTVLTEGDKEHLTMSKIGQLFTADWAIRLALAGRVYSLPFGSITDGDLTFLTGNAAMDNDQPEFLVSVATGWLIPIELHIGCVDDMDAYDDIIECLIVGDRTQSYTAGGTATVPLNSLDGGDAFSGYCGTIVTAGITAPVGSDILYYKQYELTQITTETGGSAIQVLEFNKTWAVPTFLAGACTIMGCVVGTGSPTFAGYFKFAHLPASWIAIS